MAYPSYFKLKGDAVLWVIFFVLCTISLVEVFSAGSTLAFRDGNFWFHFLRQAAFLFVGVIFCVLTHNIPANAFKFVPAIGWPVSIFLLIYVTVKGAMTNGAARWISLGGFTFQPSELAKGVLVCTVALILSKAQREKRADDVGFKNTLILSFPIVFLIFTENFSTAVLLFGVIFLMMFIARVRLKRLFQLMGVGILGIVLFVLMMGVLPKDSNDSFYKAPVVGKVLHRFPVWRERLSADDMAMPLSPDSFVVTDDNRQKVHARIAVSNCKRGMGHMPGNSVQRDYLSQAYSDFIFAIIVEELGLWGAGIIVLLYLILLYRAGMIASRCGKNFPAFLIMGIAMLLVSQAILNMMVAVGLFPVTGQPLPLVSRGGTSTLITCAYFGVMLSISRFAQEYQAKRAAKLAMREQQALQENEVIAEDSDEIALTFTNDEGLD